MCGSLFSVKMEYEYYPLNLQKEIKQRSLICQTHFSILELLRVTYDLIDLFAFLETKMVNHGEVNPTLIFLAEDQISGLLRPKVCERLSGCGNKFMNNLQMYTNRKDLYICPMLYQNIVKGSGKHKIPVNSHKSEVFSVGLCLLEMGILESIQEIYDFDNSSFDDAILKHYLDLFENLYKEYPLLVSIVRQMLITDQTTRPNFGRLKKALPNWEGVEPELVNKPSMFEMKVKKNGFAAKMGSQLEVDDKPYGSSNISMLRNELETEEKSISPKSIDRHSMRGRESQWMSGKGVRIGESPGVKGEGFAYMPDSSRLETGQDEESSRLMSNEEWANQNQKMQDHTRGLRYDKRGNELQIQYQSKDHNQIQRKSRSSYGYANKQRSQREVSSTSHRSRSMTPGRNPLKIRIGQTHISNSKLSKTRVHNKNMDVKSKYSNQHNMDRNTRIVSSQSNSLYRKYTTLQAPVDHAPGRDRDGDRQEMIRGTYPDYRARIRSQQHEHTSQYRPGSYGQHQTVYADQNKNSQQQFNYHGQQSTIPRRGNHQAHEPHHYKETVWTGREKKSQKHPPENLETMTMNKNYEPNFMTSGETNMVPNRHHRGRHKQQPPALDIHSISRNLSKNKDLTFSKTPEDTSHMSDFKSMHLNKSRAISRRKMGQLSMTPNGKGGARGGSVSPPPNMGQSTIQNKTGKKRRKKSASIFDFNEKSRRDHSAGVSDLAEFPRYSAQPVHQEFFTLRETGYRRYRSNIVNEIENLNHRDNNRQLFDQSKIGQKKCLKKGRTRSFNQDNSKKQRFGSSRQELEELNINGAGTSVTNVNIPPLSGLTSPGQNLNGEINGTTTSRGISSHDYTNGVYDGRPAPGNTHYGYRRAHPLEKTLKNSEQLHPHKIAKVGGVRRFSQNVIQNIGKWFSGSEKSSQGYSQESNTRAQGYSKVLRAQASQPSSFSSRYQSKGSILSRREFSSGKEPSRNTESGRQERLMSSINEIDRSGEVSDGHNNSNLNSQESGQYRNRGSQPNDKFSKAGAHGLDIDDINNNLRNRPDHPGFKKGNKLGGKMKIQLFKKKSSAREEKIQNEKQFPNTMSVRLDQMRSRRNSNHIQRNKATNKTKKFSLTNHRKPEPWMRQESGLEESGKNPIRSNKTSERQGELETVFNSNSKKKNPYNRVAKKQEQIERSGRKRKSYVQPRDSKSQTKLKKRRSREHKLYERDSFLSPENTIIRSQIRAHNHGSRISKSNLGSVSPVSKMGGIRVSQNKNHLQISRKIGKRLAASELSRSEDRTIQMSDREPGHSRVSSVFSHKKERPDLSKNLSRISLHSKRKNRLRERSESKESRKRKSNIQINHQKFIPNKSRISRPPIRKRVSSIKSGVRRTNANFEDKENMKHNSVVRIMGREFSNMRDDSKYTGRSQNGSISGRGRTTYRRRGSGMNNGSMRSLMSHDRAGKLKSDCVTSIQMKIAGVRDSHKSKIISEDSIVCDISSFRENDTRSANKVSKGPGRYVVSKSIPNKGKMAPSRIERRGSSFYKSSKSNMKRQHRAFQEIRLGQTEMMSGKGTGIFRFDTKGKMIRADLLQSRASMESQKVSAIKSFQNARKFREALQQFVDQGIFRN